MTYLSDKTKKRRQLFSLIFITVLLLILSFGWMEITITSTAILSPFIATGTLDQFLKAQGLASVHTMLSANNPNFPWLFGFLLKGKFPDVISLGNGSQTTILKPKKTIH